MIVMIRSFIAIDLPKETRKTLAAIQEQLKQSRARVRWVRANSIHLTLKFLGDIHPGQVDDIAAVTAQVVRNEPLLTLCAAGLGAFPNQRNPRVIWVGIDGEVKRLTHIQTRLEHDLVPLGFARERRGFRVHLTLGRVRDKRNRQALIDAMAELKIPEFDSFDVTEIILYKSDLRLTGAIYTKLHRMSLAASASV
jgi:2'-5' RNA ligase